MPIQSTVFSVVGVSIWPWPPATHSTPTKSTTKKFNPVLLLILILFSLSQACSNSLFSTPATTYNEPSQQNSSQPPLQSSHSKLFNDNLFVESSNAPVQPSIKSKTSLFINQPSVKSKTSLFITQVQQKANCSTTTCSWSPATHMSSPVSRERPVL